MTIPELKLKLVLSNNDVILGAGKIQLLKSIDREKSLSKAARVIGMSYRRAWLLIQELNESLAEPVLITQKGGQAGGGSVLTPTAFQVIAMYDRMTEEANRATAGTRKMVTNLLKPN